MAGFSKTIIVDKNAAEITGQRYQDILTAVNYLSNGGTIIVEEYDSTGLGYEISGAISLPSNITLIGRGNVLLTVRSESAAFTSTGSRVVISGFNIKADRPSLLTYSSQMIHFQNTKNCVIENCTLTAIRFTTYSVGIFLEGTGSTSLSEGNVISGCSIGDSQGNSFATGIGLGQYCCKNMISNNVVERCRNNCTLKDNSDNNIIMGNVFKNSTDFTDYYGGIYLYNSHNNAIVGNECTGNAKYGIYLRSSSGCTVQGNVCKGNTLEGIRLAGDSSTSLSRYNSVMGNVCCNNSQPGILVAENASYNAVDGNTATANLYGIRENVTNYNVVVGNVCNGNTTANIQTSGAQTVSAGNIA